MNLCYSLNKEVLSTNNIGAYWSSTLLCCNTRKYHGLLICPIEEFDNENHILLSSLDETVIQHGAEFHLGIHKFPYIYQPKGHKYVRNFEFDPIPKITYRVGGVVLEKEILLVEDEMQLLIKYTLKEAHSATTLQLKPFLAFRNIHQLSHANLNANTKFKKNTNGINMKLYNGFPGIHMQLSKHNEYVPTPNWYYNIEYIEEQKRGYDYQEDLYVPGYFEVPIKKGESIIFSAALKEATPTTLKRKFTSEIEKKATRESFVGCLEYAAKQFIIKKGKKTEIVAGYPWFGRWGRDTFISLPGLTLVQNDTKSCKEVLDTMSSELKHGLFPNMGNGSNPALNSVDAPLWFFWAVKKYADFTGEHEKIWKDYGSKMKQILKTFKNGTKFNINMHDNGLIYSGEIGVALTWMDAVVEGKPVTPRTGYNVEINALWYFAIQFTLDLANSAKDKSFTDEWKDLPILIKNSFIKVFWDDKKGYLADVADIDQADWAVRPNQIFATSLDYSPLTDEMKNSVLNVVKNELVTTRGLRTLSPKNPNYKGKYEGSQAKRDSAYHQGTVWPWLLGHFAEGYLKIHKKSGVTFIKKLLSNFEEDIDIHGVGSISEVYDGDPPHRPGGAISQAWSVAELLRINYLVKKYARLK
ncbi:amylo-alpha-1,6-glucosidase [Bacteroidota bacterium]